MTRHAPPRVKAPPRRSREDMALARFLTIGDRFRRRSDQTIWTVRNVYRSDCACLLRHLGERDRTVLLETLRKEYVYIADHTRAAA